MMCTVTVHVITNGANFKILMGEMMAQVMDDSWSAEAGHDK